MEGLAKKHESVLQSYQDAFVCLYIWYWNNGKKNLDWDWIGRDQMQNYDRCQWQQERDYEKTHQLSSRKVERSTIVISTIHFCLVWLARIGHLFYSNITFVELNHGSELCTIIVMFDFITKTFFSKTRHSSCQT